MNQRVIALAFCVVCVVAWTCSKDGSSSVTPGAQVPSADFSGTNIDGFLPLTVTFEDKSTGAIDQWYWEFGDGQTSTEQHPTHEYTEFGEHSGVYNVKLIVVGAAGPHSIEKPGYITTHYAAPEAAFTAAPTVGAVPMPVQFTDQSQNQVATWSWNFGDPASGNQNSSSEQNPRHTYSAPGNYTVRLTVTGPGEDQDTRLMPAFVQALVPVGDPSFESQGTGVLPQAPWSVVGTGHRIRPFAPASNTDRWMPTQGTKWCEISTLGSADTTPPSNPTAPGQTPENGNFTLLPVGGLGISQMIRYPAERTLLKFEAAFISKDSVAVGSQDWMSVDITDGVAAYNLYYRDTSTPFSNVDSSIYDVDMTPVETVRADLSQLFEDSTTSTLLMISVVIGNRGTGAGPANGYVDNFRFEPALTAVLAKFTNTTPNGFGTSEHPFEVTFTNQSSNATSRTWNFFDGFCTSSCPTGQQETHPYTTVGNYTVALRATNGSNYDITAIPSHVHIQQGPLADFDAPTNAAENQPVVFDNESSGADPTNPQCYRWDWGDGATTTQNFTAPNPSHLYEVPNNLASKSFTVKLTVFGAGGQVDESPPFSITVHAPPNVRTTTSASLVNNSYEAAVNAPINFNAILITNPVMSGAVSSWKWEFGDPTPPPISSHSGPFGCEGLNEQCSAALGTSPNQVFTQSASHTYYSTTCLPNHGVKVVKLTATGPGGVREYFLDHALALRTTFAMVRSVFKSTPGIHASCTGCHTSSGGDGGLDLDSPANDPNHAWNELVGAPAEGPGSCDPPNMNRVTASDPCRSYLLVKVLGGPACTGSPGLGSGCVSMPPSYNTQLQAYENCGVSASNPCMCSKHIELIRDWIAAGAKNN